MKCEHCGCREATFYYRSNINGQVNEAHLCEECAEALGYRTGGSFGDLLSMVSGDFFGDRFFAMPRLTPSARRTIHVLPSEQEHEKPLIDPEEQQKLRQTRERNALQVALNEALDAEDYERAATLRDELRRFENR